MVPPSQQNYSRLHPKLIVTQTLESWKRLIALASRDDDAFARVVAAYG
jgi:hypothetical protein